MAKSLLTVTPFVGVWIETHHLQCSIVIEPSHPSWVCGLKLFVSVAYSGSARVTPFVGVWIETGISDTTNIPKWVTPFVGVWIETFLLFNISNQKSVTPFVGVWIETDMTRQTSARVASHTLRGCVD